VGPDFNMLSTDRAPPRASNEIEPSAVNTPLALTLFACLLSYLVGSIPFGLLIARSKGIDIRTQGSGNIGATNVGRVLGRRYGLLCFNLDFAKGLLPPLVYGLWRTGLLGALSPQPLPPLGALDVLGWLAVATCAILGHVFPVWLRFKGGKGVATSFGALLGVFPVMSIAVLVGLFVWVVSLKLTRMVGISSCIAAALMPIVVMFEAPLARRLGIDLPNTGVRAGEASVAWPYLVVTTALAALVIAMHRGNIARTIAGTENKVRI
jgi:acyl phosphate:glycerol-3-phosphate acyltransferase